LAALAPAAAAAPRAANAGLRAPDRADWRALLGWSAACEGPYRVTFPDGGPNAGLAFWPFGAGRLLVQVQCASGAYQGISTLYLVDRSRTPARARGLALTVYEAPGAALRRSRARLVNGAIEPDPSTGRLQLFTRFRGLGDCGVLATYALRGGRFVPQEVRAKLACDGRPPYDPARWPRRPLSPQPVTASRRGRRRRARRSADRPPAARGAPPAPSR
jgi:hypothetical protein